MSDLSLYIRISSLPDKVKSHLMDYLDSIVSKKKDGRGPAKIYPKAGCMKGTFKMDGNFDDQMDDFKEYM